MTSIQFIELIRNLPFHNLDLLSVGVAIAAILVLGVVIYLSNKKSITNKSFLYLATSASLWSIFNYLNYQTESEEITLLLLRLLMFCAVWFAFSLFQFLYFFPDAKKTIPFWYNVLLVPSTVAVMIMTLTPLVFNRIVDGIKVGTVAKVENGPGIIFFAILVFFLVGGGIVIFIKKVMKSKEEDRARFKIVLAGIIFTFIAIITLNFILPAFFSYYSFIPLGALFIFPFIAFTSYAILKHKLFNIKVVATGILVFILAIVTFLEIILSDNFSLVLFRGGVFLLVLVIGILLIRSVFREVEQREKIEKLAQELTQKNDELYVANERLKELDQKKTEFVSIASHQLRSPLTAIKGYSSMILEGSFGPIKETAKEAVHRIFESSQRLVVVIEDFLNITRIELGKMKYEISDFDMEKTVKTIAGELANTAQRRNLQLDINIPKGAYMVHADFGKVSQAVQNLIDNAIKYTEPGGKINVSLTRVEDKTRLAVKDSGIGISPEGMKKLFEKFSRAEDGSTVNTIGTGLGLYVAKEIIEAQGGKIWAESEGLGKGSTFFLELK